MLDIRTGKRSDLPAALEMIRELAIYERADDQVSVDLDTFERYLEQNLFRFLIATCDGEPAGLALYYVAYSTWKGPIVYLDDFVVRESYRRTGVGSRLFSSLVDICRKLEVKQMRWHVLEWNESALRFYQKHGAELDGEWTTGRLNISMKMAF